MRLLVADPETVDLVQHIAQRDLLIAACVVVVSIVAGYIIAVNA